MTVHASIPNTTNSSNPAKNIAVVHGVSTSCASTSDSSEQDVDADRDEHPGSRTFSLAVGPGRHLAEFSDVPKQEHHPDAQGEAARDGPNGVPAHDVWQQLDGDHGERDSGGDPRPKPPS